MYKKAIEQNEVIQFFRGEGEYFDLDRDRGGHDSGFTKMHIIGLGTEQGDQILYDQLEKDLHEYMSLDDFKVEDFRLIIGIIWFYIVYRYDENLLRLDWKISESLRSTIKNRYSDFKTIGIDVSNVDRVLNNMKDRFNFVLFD